MRAGAEVSTRPFSSATGGAGLRTSSSASTAADLGAWGYEVADTKLARRAKPAHVLQLCFYSEQLARIQGARRERMHVVLGTGERETLRPADFGAYYRRVRERFLARVEARPTTVPVPGRSTASSATSASVCERRWDEDDHLSRWPACGATRSSGSAAPASRRWPACRAAPPRDGAAHRRRRFEKLREQAELQLAERETGAPRYRLLAPEESAASRCCRRPRRATCSSTSRAIRSGSPKGGLEYLFGVLWREDGELRSGPSGRTTATRSSGRSRQLVDFFHERLRGRSRRCTSTTTRPTSRPR